MFKSVSLHPRLGHWLEILGTAGLYFILARLSLLLQFQSTNATPVWPPSGFAFAMILLLGPRVAPGIILGAFAANMIVFLSNHVINLPTAIYTSFAICIGNTGESLVGYYLLKKMIPNGRVNHFFRNVNYIFRFLFVAVMMCVVSCTIGATSILIAKIINPNQYPVVWITWWLGDVSGILLVSPFILIWAKFFTNRQFIFGGTWKRKIETSALFLTVLLTSGIIFDNWFFPLFIFRWAFWIIPVLVWAAFRFSQRETVSAIVLCSIIAIWGTVNGHGPFAVDSLNESLLTMQAFVSIIAITNLALNASVMERKQTEAILRDTGNQLEIRVQERTAELVHTTNQLTEKNLELEKMNHELASFSYVASHDLQEPLRKIQTFAKRILEKEINVLSENGKDYFNRMENAANRMQQLIEDLLAYSRTNTSEKHFEKTDLNILLGQVKNEFKEKITETNTRMEADFLPRLNVIPFQFKQLFTNIISNSIKFARHNITPYILIRYDIVKGTEINAANIPATKKYHHFMITDNGIGFGSEYNKQIFELFQRLHSRREYEGTGIGLAICKKIVENHNGIITASGEPEKGATFHIYLPVSGGGNDS